MHDYSPPSLGAPGRLGPFNRDQSRSSICTVRKGRYSTTVPYAVVVRGFVFGRKEAQRPG